MKLGIVLDDELCERMDEYVEEHYMSRSGLISYALSQFLNADRTNKAIQDMATSLHKIADFAEKEDKEYFDKEVKTDLDKLETVAAFLAQAFSMRFK